MLALLFGDLKGCGRIGVLDDDVGALAEQHLGGVGFLARIVPGVDPDDLHLEIGIDRLRAEHEGVDAGDDFRNREGNDVAGHARLRHLGGDLADHIAAFMELGIVGRDVVGGLEAGRMLELHIGKFLGDLQRRLHEAEGGGEDDGAAVARQTLDGALGIGFGDILDDTPSRPCRRVPSRPRGGPGHADRSSRNRRWRRHRSSRP